MLNTQQINQQLAHDPEFQRLRTTGVAASPGGTFQDMHARRQSLNDYVKAKYGVDPTQQSVDPNTGTLVDTPQDNTLGTIGHVLKVAAPIAATIMSGGALSPLAAAAMGAGGSAVGGAMSGDHGWGLVGDAALGAAPVGAKALMAGGAATSAASGMPAPLEGSAATTNLMNGGMDAAGGFASAPAVSGGGSVMSRLLGGSGTQTPGAGGSLVDLSRAIGSAGQAAANSRGAANADMNRYGQTAIEAQTARDKDETDAMNKLAQTSYIMGGGSSYKPGNLSLNGHTYALDDHGTGPAPISDIQKQGAGALQAQLMQRLNPGGSFTPTPPQTSPSTGENIANAGSLITSGLGLAKNMGWI